MGTFRNPVTIDNTGTLGGTTNPTTSQALPMERENQRAIRELVGAFGYEALTIASGSITPTKAEITVDTEAGASADDLTTILLVSDGSTTLHDGMLLKIRAYDPARVVTVKHNTGTNQIQTLTGADVVLGTTWELTLKLVSGVWKEVAGKPVVDITGNAATATSAAACTGNSATATRADTLKQGGIIAPTSAGTSTAYTVTSSPVVAAYTAGTVHQFAAHTACGAAPTVNFDGLGAKVLKKFSGGSKASLAASDIPSGALVQCLYDGTDMVVTGLSGAQFATGDVRQIVTASTTSVFNVTAVTPYDNTTPQDTEGTQILTLSITPKAAGNKVIVRAICATEQASQSHTLHLHTPASANAFAALCFGGQGSDIPMLAEVSGEFTAASTSAVTVQLRIGVRSSGVPVNVNRTTTNNPNVGGSIIHMTATEVQA